MDDAKLLDRVNELFYVDVVAGKFFWRVNKSRAKSGSEAGSKLSTGYIKISFDQKSYLRHRLIFFIANGYFPKEIDHINQVRGDDRIENLRSATKSQNRQNRPISSKNTSGETGISWNKSRKKWHAYVKLHGKRVFSKYFSSIDDAVQAVREARAQHHGEFSADLQRLNSDIVHPVVPMQACGADRVHGESHRNQRHDGNGLDNRVIRRGNQQPERGKYVVPSNVYAAHLLTPAIAGFFMRKM